MAHDSDIEKRLLELEDVHTGLALVESRLATAWVQRLSGPGVGLFFAGLALTFFGDEIRSAAPGSPQFFWIMLFAVGAVLGVVSNEVRSQRVLLRLRTERDGLLQALKDHDARSQRLPAP